MQLTFLQAAVPLTKKYTKKPNGEVESGSYPGVTNFTSHVEDVTTCTEFAEKLIAHAAEGRCLLTNSLRRPIVDESRAKLSDKDEPRKWIMMDIDGFDVPDVETFVKTVLPSPFHSVSYVVQHSPSSGIKPGVRVHIFFMLDTEVSTRMVSTWLKWQNLATQQLRDQITLSNSEYALSLKLDWVANNNGRIVYITAPECEGFSDPVTDRISVVEKDYDLLSFNFGAVSIEKINQDYQEQIKILRDAAGLPVSKKAKYYRFEGDKCFLNKDMVTPGAITGYIEDNDMFMRCNLNGGDSEAYYYHRNNPRYLHNFKGEPSIPLELLDKHHYDTIAKPWADKLQEKNLQPFVFRNEADDKYYIGIRKGSEVERQPNQIGSQQKIDHYYTEYGMAPPDPIPTWTRTFDPRTLDQYREDLKQFNTWCPTDIMQNAMYRSKAPEIISKVVMHAVGNDQEAYDRFMNWVAYIFQNRTKTGTAWILHGVPGTGKGLITQHILPGIFGIDYCVTQQVRDLKQAFNGWIEQAIFVTIDEANTDDAGAESKQVVEALKLWITESRLNLRQLYCPPRMVRNFSNFIFTSNDFGVLPIRPGDRRFSVGLRQEEPLDISPDEVDQIKFELAHFAGYLQGYEVDKQLAHAPMMNSAKAAIMEYKLSSIEEFVRAVQNGDLMFFLDNWELGIISQETVAVDAVLNQWIEDLKAGKPSLIRTQALLTVYEAIVSGRTSTPIGKFTKNMERHLLSPQRMRYEGKRAKGWLVDWNVDQEDLVDLGAHIKPVKTQKELEVALADELRVPIFPLEK